MFVYNVCPPLEIYSSFQVLKEIRMWRLLLLLFLSIFILSLEYMYFFYFCFFSMCHIASLVVGHNRSLL